MSTEQTPIQTKKRPAADTFSPTSAAHSSDRDAKEAKKDNVTHERKGYNVILFKHTLEPFTSAEYDALEEGLTDYQLEHSVKIVIDKNFRDAFNRSLTIRTPEKDDISKITDAISILPVISGSSISHYIPHNSLPENRVYLYLRSKHRKYVTRSTIFKWIALSTNLSVNDLKLFAPAKLLKDSRIMLPLILTPAAMNYFAEQGWRLHLLGTSLKLRVSEQR